MISFLLKLFRGDVSKRVSTEFDHAIGEFDVVRERFRSLVSMCDERKGEIASEVDTLIAEQSRIDDQQERIGITLTNFDALLGDKVLATGNYVAKD